MSAAQIMSGVMSTYFSWLLILFLVATSLPLFAEMWIEFQFKTAVIKMVKQFLTLSPLMFIFQAKVIGHYVVNELRYGGATYVSTGRGLPTERRPLIGEAAEGGGKLKKVGGLYLDYASIAYYDGICLLANMLLLCIAGGNTDHLGWFFFSVSLTIVSWLFAPFIFNPYQFVYRHFREDWQCVRAFFTEDSGRHWVEWYDRTQLKAGQTSPRSCLDIGFFWAPMVITCWYVAMEMKIEAFVAMYSQFDGARAMYSLM